jgi:hypothetical protein
MDNKQMKQYNAAMLYVQKNQYRVNKSNAIFIMSIMGITLFMVMQFFIKYYSCFNRY